MGLFDIFKKKKDVQEIQKQTFVEEIIKKESIVEEKKSREWYETMIDDFSKDIDEYFITVTSTSNSYTAIVYEVINNEIVHSPQMNKAFFDKYKAFFDLCRAEKGIRIFRYNKGILIDKKYISHYNVELFNNDICELIIYQEYGMYPAKDDRKEVLQTSIKAEKIKDTLVYACYINDTEKIFKCLEKCSKAQLNKNLEYTGTPLGLCAENNNLTAFKAIVENGADLSKKSLGSSPLEIAFRYSPEIVRYISENHREQFEKEVSKAGFSMALHTTDIELFDLIRDCGCDMECEGKSFPPLHNFVDYNNVVGIQYLADHGANLNILNKNKQTALERANGRNIEAVELLKKLMGV